MLRVGGALAMGRSAVILARDRDGCERCAVSVVLRCGFMPLHPPWEPTAHRSTVGQAATQSLGRSG